MLRRKSFSYAGRLSLLAAIGFALETWPLLADARGGSVPGTSVVDATPPSSDAAAPTLHFPAPQPDAPASASPAGTTAPVSAPDLASSSANPPMPDSSPNGNSPASGDDASGSSTPPSPNAMVNLVNLLVAQHVITQGAGDKLIKQALDEASTASRAIAVATANTARPSDSDSGEQSGPSPAVPVDPDDEGVHVAYVPDVVKNQITDQVTANVMKKAQDQHWGSMDNIPEWVHRFHVTGDIRARYQGDFYPDGNATGSIVNFNAINTGSPFDINTSTQRSGLIPTYNVDRDRDLFRLRARIGAGIDISGNFFAGMRLATGSDNSPVSENQTLGAANGGQGGNFSKYQIWLDRAYITYEIGGVPTRDFSLSVGRFDNPFFSTSMLWQDDIAFDGFVAKGRYGVGDGVTTFVTAGAFPIFNTDLNFGTNSTLAGNGYESNDKWLYAAQVGADWNISKDFTAGGAFAFYDFDNIKGQVSSPITEETFAAANGSSLNGDTDDSRPSFAQHGNTYIALRNIQSDVSNAADYEYFGLASAFQEVALTGQVSYIHFDPIRVWLIGEFVDNVAFDRSAIRNEGPAILPGPQNNNNGSTFEGDGIGYNIRLSAGIPKLAKLWDWNVNLTYRYVGSDATVDAFTDSDFGGALSGTNLQGFILGANLAFAPGVWGSVRLLQTDEIAGPPLRTDTVQVDLNAKF